MSPKTAPFPVDRLAKALSDPIRLGILDLLAQRRREGCCSPEQSDLPQAWCACDLGPALGGIPPSKLAYHLKALREAGLVKESSRGKWVYYELDPARVQAFARALQARFGMSGCAS